MGAWVMLTGRSGHSLMRHVASFDPGQVYDGLTQEFGESWDERIDAPATPEQKKRLGEEFKTLLIRTYSSALRQYRDQTIDYKPLRTEDISGVWVSAAANMRTYLLLKERAAAWRSDPEVQQAMAESLVAELAQPLGQAGKTSWEQADARDIQQWMVQLLGRYSSAYASNQYRGLQQFFKWHAEDEEVEGRRVSAVERAERSLLAAQERVEGVPPRPREPKEQRTNDHGGSAEPERERRRARMLAGTSRRGLTPR